MHPSSHTPSGRNLVSATLFAVLCIASSDPAAAAIKCDGPFQIIKGIGPHASNYCEDGYLAAIARESYGLRVGATEMRNNPGLKHRTCIAIGHDSRLISICSNHRVMAPATTGRRTGTGRST